MHWIEKSEKLPSLLTKTENQRLNMTKPADRARHQNKKKPQFSSVKTENPNPKIDQIRKTENPNDLSFRS